MVERWFESHSAEATEALGEALGARLRIGDVVALSGDLGSGKTTLVRGLARGLGVAADEVSSPTFALAHEYVGRVPVYHLDAWMAGRESVFLEGGGAELLGGNGVALVEWADKILAWLPPARIEVELSHRDAETRGLVLRALDIGLQELLSGLEVPEGITERSPKL